MKQIENRANIEQWNSRHAIGMLITTLYSLYAEHLLFVLGFALVSFAVYMVRNRSMLQSLVPFAGYANWITSFRLILLVSLFIFEPPYFVFVSGLVLVVCLDGLDGWMARKYNHATLFGQYFDMELDALFVLLMCCWYYLFQDVGLWILIPGLLRFVYKIGIDLFPKNHFKESKKRYASTIAGVFFVSLLIGLVLEGNPREINLAIGAALIIFSFSVSIFEYIRFQDVTTKLEI